MTLSEFLSTLQNPEKSRNFRSLEGYSLDNFQRVWDAFSYRESSSLTSKIRIGIVGTNGKGSLAHYLGKYLEYAGISYGTYTSPHFYSWNERISWNGTPVSINYLEGIFSLLSAKEKTLLGTLSYFEVLTILCRIAFLDLKPNFEILEAGLGGRLDATKLFACDYIALTKIGLDHTEILGDTKEKIIKEKLGIITENTKKVFALEPTGDDAKSLIDITESFLDEKKIELIWIQEKAPSDTDYLSLYKRMSNAILSFILEKKFPVEIELSPPAGRLEVISKDPLWIYDTAHNPQAVKNALENILQNHRSPRYGETKKDKPGFHLLLGILPDKDGQGIEKELEKFSEITQWGLLSYPPFGNHWEKLKSNKAHIIPTEKDLEIWMRERINSKTPVVSMGSFRIYPLIRRFLRVD